MKSVMMLTLLLAGGWDMLGSGPVAARGDEFDMLGERPQSSAETQQAHSAAEASAENGPVRTERPLRRRLLIYAASWCGPCRSFKESALPRLITAGWRVGAGPRDHITFIDCDDCLPPGIEALPTFVLLAEGREIDRHVGLLDEWSVGEFVKGYSERPVAPGERFKQ